LAAEADLVWGVAEDVEDFELELVGCGEGFTALDNLDSACSASRSAAGVWNIRRGIRIGDVHDRFAGLGVDLETGGLESYSDHAHALM
jgi:hypothetical protein